MTVQTQSRDRDLVGRMTDWVKDCFRRDADLREWQGLDGAERGRVAHDLGMGSGDLGTLMAASGGAAELDDLLTRTGLQQAAAMRGALHDLQRVCGLCQQRSDCRDWLSVPVDARDEGAMPQFCPNREELQALREMHEGRSCRR